MKCPGCGAMNVDNAVECSMCGRELPASISADKGPPPRQANDIIERIEHAPHYKPSRVPHIVVGAAIVVLVPLVLWLRPSSKGLAGAWEGQYGGASATLLLSEDGACRLECSGRAALEGRWKAQGDKLAFAWSNAGLEEEWWVSLSDSEPSLKAVVSGTKREGQDWQRVEALRPEPGSSKWQTWRRIGSR